jgi:trk system potassium uptake protein
MINFRLVIRFWGIILAIFSGFMATALIPSFIYHDGAHWPILTSFLITIAVAGGFWWLSDDAKNKLYKKDGYLIVFGSWLLMCLFGSLPYFLSGSIGSPTDIFFESVSGFTTTGASVLKDIEAELPSILYWRSMTQWIGGMGIIVLTVAMLPLLGVGGVELFTAESSMPTSDKIHPRIKYVARSIWLIYVGLTVAVIALFVAGGMNIFDAVNHAFTTLSTGGFSNKNASMGYFVDSPLIIYSCIAFMLIASVNFTLLYFGFKGKIKKIWANDEFRGFVLAILLATMVATFLVTYFSDTTLEGERLFRDVLFQVVSIISTTGYATADFQAWGAVLTFTFFLYFFIGGCAGSTSGSIKIVRHLVLFRHSILELKRVLHPRAMIPVKLDKQNVEERVITHILVFLLVYMFLFAFGALLLVMMNMDILSAIGASATAITNVGPGIGSVGPAENFAHVPVLGKYVLMFLMLAGRLEIFTVIIFLSPDFWKKH